MAGSHDVSLLSVLPRDLIPSFFAGLGRPDEALGQCSAYTANWNFNVKVLDFVKSGGPKWMVGGRVFEMWLGSL